MDSTVHITTCYRFLPLNSLEVADLQAFFEGISETEDLRGLCLIGPEGFNFTISGPVDGIERLKVALRSRLNDSALFFKDSLADKHPFHNFKVKIKAEIVTLGRPGLVPQATNVNHMSPSEWHEALQDPNTVVIDTRNDYEVEVGKFKSAIHFDIKEFHEFPERLKAQDLNKSQRTLIYCTGGIRCEKAILAMHEQGFSNVHQLDGGILNYLKEYPDAEFTGECFVFDYRVAVDQKLQPTTQFKLCVHCGQPASESVDCSMCGHSGMVCSSCQTGGIRTCSKNCQHHKELGSDSHKPHMQELHKRHRI